MRKHFRPTALAITLLAAAVTAVLRVWLTPGMQDTQTGTFHISYVVIGVLLFSMCIIAGLLLPSSRTLPYMGEMPKKYLMPVKAASIFAGAVLILSSLFDGWVWASFGRTPPPNDVIIGRLDSLTLTFTILFGLLAGLFLLWLGVKFDSGKKPISSVLSLGALAPVVWIWVRLVRYQVSYASAIQVGRSFYDFVMLIFTMLFLFAFARYISQTGKRASRTLLFYSLCTALHSLTGPLVLVALYLSGETEAYNSSRLAGISDFAIGIFALCISVSLIFSPCHEEQPEAQIPDGEDLHSLYEKNLDTMPTVDEILKDFEKPNE